MSDEPHDDMKDVSEIGEILRRLTNGRHLLMTGMSRIAERGISMSAARDSPSGLREKQSASDGRRLSSCLRLASQQLSVLESDRRAGFDSRPVLMGVQ